MKHNVALVQVNYKFGNNVFLPHSAGLVRAYCEIVPEIADSFNFLDFVYLRKDPVKVAKGLDSPRIVGISCYLWNWEWSKELAQAIRGFFPDCLIVMGGPQVPVRSQDFFRLHEYVDILVHYEGEITFSEILLEYLCEQPDYTKVRGISVRTDENGCLQSLPRDRTTDLEVLPSPYLAGCFDSVMQDSYDFHASQETHRGCPYSCTFCDWGSAVFTKIRAFSDERLYEELEWFGRNRIELLYNCDANFGLLRRDLALTNKMVETKSKYGFPKQFRAAYAKNSSLKILEISKLLNASGMSKGLTLSFQSLDDHTLDLIRRSNIKVDDLQGLLKIYRTEGIATYTEIIIGLPGETYSTFAQGIGQLLDAGQHDGLNIYICVLLPNSEMSDPEYVLHHGIKSVKCPVLLAHTSQSEEDVVEYSDVVIETNTMPLDSFRRIFLFSWVVQAFHSMGLTKYLALYWRNRIGLPYQVFYEGLIDYAAEKPGGLIGKELASTSDVLEGALGGGGWGVVLPDFGDVLWTTEEASFLGLVRQKDELFYELSDFFTQLLLRHQVVADEDELRELFVYQKNMVVDAYTPDSFTLNLEHCFHKYFDQVQDGISAVLDKEPNVLEITSEETFEGDLEEYARTIVWYGRKAGKLSHKNVRQLPFE